MVHKTAQVAHIWDILFTLNLVLSSFLNILNQALKALVYGNWPNVACQALHIDNEKTNIYNQIRQP